MTMASRSESDKAQNKVEYKHDSRLDKYLHDRGMLKLENANEKLFRRRRGRPPTRHLVFMYRLPSRSR